MFGNLANVQLPQIVYTIGYVVLGALAFLVLVLIIVKINNRNQYKPPK